LLTTVCQLKLGGGGGDAIEVAVAEMAKVVTIAIVQFRACFFMIISSS
jgi:hypothetical protein